jgi:hypothetical protein
MKAIPKLIIIVILSLCVVSCGKYRQQSPSTGETTTAGGHFGWGNHYGSSITTEGKKCCPDGYSLEECVTPVILETCLCRQDTTYLTCNTVSCCPEGEYASECETFINPDNNSATCKCTDKTTLSLSGNCTVSI